MSKTIHILSLIFMMTISSVSVYSQTLHAIIFANTQSPGNPNNPRDPGIGPSVTVDFERMGLELTSISSFIGYNLKKYYYYGTQDRFNRNCLINVLNNLSCGKDDIVFFYYSGHGARYENEDSQYPEMILKVPYGSVGSQDVYPLYDVYKQIMRKSPRLTIVFGDLCNSTWKGAFKPNNNDRGASMKSDAVCDVYKNLFLNVKGGLIATSSKPGQTSGCAQFSDGSEAGGRFTASFLQCLGSYVSSGRNVNWETLLTDSRNLTIEISGEHRQYPVFSTKDLVVAPPPTTYTNTPSTVTSTDEQITSQDNIALALSNIANNNKQAIERIKGIPNVVSRYFANNQARVQVVGRDCKTIVNTTTIQSYLNYLSIAVNMDQVIVLDEKKNDSNKVTYIKVHEVHK